MSKLAQYAEAEGDGGRLVLRMLRAGLEAIARIVPYKGYGGSPQ